ncbi:MAG: NAD synthetase, partial [Alphaproteobacteria bacterium]|nr:NAD synthetase [Alphaproteobacteria bacterium]
MTAGWLTLSYLVSGVLFILALRGLSSPVSARQGNMFGMVGMGLAIVSTLLAKGEWSAYLPILLAIAAGGAIGTYIARTIAMTALPQLVAAFHSLVGLAAVFVAAAAFYAPDRFNLLEGQHIKLASLIEMGLGTAIGAITFSGSVIAFGKLQGLISGKPLIFPFQHHLNLGLGLFAVLLIAFFCLSGSPVIFWTLVAVTLLLGVLLIMPIGGADMPVVISMLNSYSGWAAAGIGFTLQNNLLIITGALVGASGAILSYIMC